MILQYIFEVMVFQALFLVAYQLFLRGETFFAANRLYLICTPLIAFVLPFLQIEWFSSQLSGQEQIEFLPQVFIGEETQQTLIQKATYETNWIFWAVLVYCAGFLFSAGILFRKYLDLLRYYRFKKATDNVIITIPDSDEAFTFMNSIFLGEKIDNQAHQHILAHEEVHVRQKHSLDLLLFEVLRVVFWFNPLIYGFQKKITELHEFIADSYAAKKIADKSYYNQLLNTAFGTKNISFINTFFNHSLIKKRIVMLHKKSKNSAKLRYLLLVPLFAGMLAYVSCSDDNAIVQEEESSLSEQIINLQTRIESTDKVSSEEQKMIYSLLYKASKKTEGAHLPPPPPPAPPAPDAEIIEVVEQELTDVPFAVIDQVPVFPGCEGLDNTAAKKCMSEQISKAVNTNFNTALGKELGLEGVNRIYVRFKIDSNGEVVDIEARAKHPKLEEEAIRTIKDNLPKMSPGKQDGKEVGVLYSLPIVFQVGK